MGHSRLRKISFTQRAKRNWMAQIMEAIIMGENPLTWFCRLHFKNIDELAKA